MKSYKLPVRLFNICLMSDRMPIQFPLCKLRLIPIWDDFSWFRWLQWWKVGTRSPVVWGLFNAQDWHRMGRICWICFFWCANVEGCDSGKIMKNPNRPYLPNDIARCYGTVMFHLALHIHSTVVRMSVWSDSQQQMASDILILVVFLGIEKIIQLFFMRNEG